MTVLARPSAAIRSACVLALMTLGGCENDDPTSKRAAVETAPGKVEIVSAKSDEAATATIRRESERAAAEGRQLVVYVGAPWCEPCVRFHQAAARGELDAVFPKLRLLEFDRDRDEARLGESDCLSRLIPLFAVPDASGRCSERRIEGSIKGEGAVAEISPRLKSLLASAPSQ